MFGVLIANLLTPECVVFIAMLLCWNAKILTQSEVMLHAYLASGTRPPQLSLTLGCHHSISCLYSQALAGFSNSGMLAGVSSPLLYTHIVASSFIRPDRECVHICSLFLSLLQSEPCSSLSMQ